MASQSSGPRNVAYTIVVVAILWFLNPTREEHLAKLGPVGPSRAPTPEELAKGITSVVFQVDLDYHNYFVFSTVSRRDGGLLLTGVLRMVIDLR